MDLRQRVFGCQLIRTQSAVASGVTRLEQFFPRAVKRADQAARALLWPSVSSLEALRRQGRITLLGAS